MDWLADLGDHIRETPRRGPEQDNNRIVVGGDAGSEQGTVDLAVDPDNILQVRAALLAEAERLSGVLAELRYGLRFEPMGSDPASIAFGQLATGRLLTNPDSYFHRCTQYVENLYVGAEALAETARRYGHTEDAIAASFVSLTVTAGGSNA
ncbi:hypothetical protein [Actinoalloteichus hymeniacidonis]|uniref:Uncharacterized protein n=1 Tax=Actinoalloteichus hymeniacidonis TaxID=340345 RepID=A0AAC9MWV8_9PSEU|nr:hypothetical protein [Actinoalloteichus hymeniacidonis]AOS61740.1 hypothetical protein TL08_04550 [Actinoalloteichus hymeniacidonis]MBB5910242.1 hypothetical protein [Actinoalloteichus hymeniacidonis]